MCSCDVWLPVDIGSVRCWCGRMLQTCQIEGFSGQRLRASWRAVCVGGKWIAVLEIMPALNCDGRTATVKYSSTYTIYFDIWVLQHRVLKYNIKTMKMFWISLNGSYVKKYMKQSFFGLLMYSFWEDRTQYIIGFLMSESQIHWHLQTQLVFRSVCHQVKEDTI